MRQLVLDTETTGLDQGKDRLIEIGIIELVDRELTGMTWHTYLNPDMRIDPDATKVHGITDDDVVGAPGFWFVKDDLMDFIDGAEVIAHNAPFDIGFINHELARFNDKRKVADVAKVTDTLAIARAKYPNKRNTLDALCKRYKVDNSGRELHGALIDADLTVQVYLAMTREQYGLELTQAEVALEDRRIDTSGMDLVVIKATPEELEAHNALMERVRSGKV